MSRTRCAYRFRDGSHCSEQVHGSSNHCILHLTLPDNNDPSVDVVKHEKDVKTLEKIANGDLHFEGAHLEWTVHSNTVNSTYNYVMTFIAFPTSQDATNYLNAMNKTTYSLASTQFTSGGAYQLAAGRAPQIYKDYQWNEGNPFNISEYKGHDISQLDNMIIITTAKILVSYSAY